MENPPLAPTITQCYACLKNVTDEDVFCPDCGYPLKGTPSEQENFITKSTFRDINLAASNNQVRKAGNTLFYLAGVFALGGIVFFVLRKDDPDVAAISITDFILAILFLLLGEYSKKKPLACIISGTCLYVIVQVLNFAIAPSSVISYIWIKIIIIGFLIKGIKSALEIEKIKKENNIA